MNEYAKIGEFDESICVYKRMRKMGVEPDSYTFSCVLKCYGAVGSVVEGEKVHGFLLSLGFGCSNVVNSLIAFYFKCGELKSLYIPRQVTQLDPNPFHQNSLMQ